MDWKLELVAVPVSDGDRAKAFYTEKIGFNLDHDHQVSDDLRFVQLTPPGSACSISIGQGLTEATPGSVQGLQLVVADIEAAHAELTGRGVDAGEVQDFPWGRFIFFADPDGNRWSVQQVPSWG
ncbi:MAG TPA: glyoxalase superfamily protein [Acidimicrobiales bacterium]|nr:glyoxalase superfamily protein [Acidimicrobiales bacterium]